MTNDEPRANEIMDVLKTVRMRSAAEESGASPEIGETREMEGRWRWREEEKHEIRERNMHTS